jgi:hypothetical protein
MSDDALLRAVQAHLSDRSRVNALARLALQTVDRLALACSFAREACTVDILSRVDDAAAERSRRQSLTRFEGAMEMVRALRDDWRALSSSRYWYDYLDTLFIEINQRLPWRENEPPKVKLLGGSYDTGHRAVFNVAAYLWSLFVRADVDDCPAQIVARLDAKAGPDDTGNIRTAIVNEQASLLKLTPGLSSVSVRLEDQEKKVLQLYADAGEAGLADKQIEATKTSRRKKVRGKPVRGTSRNTRREIVKKLMDLGFVSAIDPARKRGIVRKITPTGLSYFSPSERPQSAN